MPLTTAMIQPRVSLSSMLRGAVRHAGTFLRDVDVDRARGQGYLCEARRVEASLSANVCGFWFQYMLLEMRDCGSERRRRVFGKNRYVERTSDVLRQ
jgi:hypothetical protein